MTHEHAEHLDASERAPETSEPSGVIESLVVTAETGLDPRERDEDSFSASESSRESEGADQAGDESPDGDATSTSERTRASRRRRGGRNRRRPAGTPESSEETSVSDEGWEPTPAQTPETGEAREREQVGDSRTARADDASLGSAPLSEAGPPTHEPRSEHTATPTRGQAEPPQTAMVSDETIPR